MKLQTRRALAGLTGLIALAACSGGRTRPAGAPLPRVAVMPAETDAAFELLMAGKDSNARKLLDRLLKQDPMSATAQLLSDSVKRDPKDLLGPTSNAYVVRAGDTMVGLSQRFLGNRLKAYQLLRYNGLTAPVVLTPGQVLRIPGELPRIESLRRPEPPAHTAPPSSSATTPRPRPIPPKAAMAVPTTNPAAARAARAAGLAALNSGDVNRAVGLLRRAATLDPGNPAIERDRARAERISATVRARK